MCYDVNMYCTFLKNIQSFKDKKAPYLLALSGGVDSMILYDFLKRSGFINLHIAHVDHKWSDQSTLVAKSLSKLVNQNQDLFYLHTIENIEMSCSNVEDLCRNERLKFFSRIYEKTCARTLFLAHHADDQVEVVLKRIFEGSYVANCSGMKKDSYNAGMIISRPLIHMKKADILNWAKKNEISFFEDPSNKDLRFLRSRFREKLLVDLENTFKKSIKNSILQVSYELNEIEQFLELDFKNNSFRLTEADKSLFFNIDGLMHAQIRYAVKRICKSLGEVINREQMKILMDSIVKNKSNNRSILTRYLIVYKKKCLNFNLINQ